MGGSTLPTASTPGYGRLEDRVACDCLLAWWPWFTRLGIALGIIRESFDVLQFTGANPKSAGTHAGGGVFDIRQVDPRVVALARAMGAWATYLRLWKDNEHTHGVLAGCPHVAPQAQDQLDEVRANGDGLVGNRPDPHPDPDTWRTWSQGIAWAKTELARLDREKEDDMPLTDADVARIAAATRDAVLWAPTFPGAKGLGGSSIRNNLGMGAAYSAQTLAAVRVLAGKSTTVDVDEEALALAVVEGLAPVLAAATDPERVTAALVDAIPPALAAQVVDALSARLAASS